MSVEPPNEVTQLLQQWSSGNASALPRLLELVYPELRKIAASRLRHERRGHTLQPTSLVHEAYVRLAQDPSKAWQNRTHFYAVAAKVVRGVLVDHARARLRIKRGSGAASVEFTEASAVVAATPVDVLDLDEALRALEAIDAQGARIVELRYFAGMSIEETAEAMGVSDSTVKRGWLTAKTWIRQRLGGSGAGHDR